MDTPKLDWNQIAYLIFLYEKELEHSANNDMYASSAISEARIKFMELYNLDKYTYENAQV